MRERTAGVETQTRPTLSPAQERIDLLISRVLRSGVLLAAVIGLIGLILFFVREPLPGEPQTLSELLHLRPATLATSPASLVSGALAGQPEDVMRVGLLILILTPTARVALTLILFLLERDLIFVAIAAVVLLILLGGLVGLVGG